MAVPSITTKLPTIPSEDFTKEKVLGQGGFGKVYFGKWQAIPVAVKELLVQTITDAFLKTFRSEVELMAGCQHSNTVRLFGVCVEEGKLALIMEYLEQGSLDQLLKKTEQPLSWPRRYHIAAGIGKGLAYLHNQTIIHRDLKSPNILIAQDDTAKITDFGLAKIRQENNHVTTQPVGSLPWTAPEIIQGQGSSYSSDIYSFGMILWEIASLRLPFKGLELGQMVGKKYQNQHEQIPQGTPPAYTQIIQKCWKLPDERPQTRVIAQELSLLREEAMTPSPSLSPQPKSVSVEKVGYLLESVTVSSPQNPPPSGYLLEPTAPLNLEPSPVKKEEPPKVIDAPSILNNNLVLASPTPPIAKMVNSVPSIAFGKAEWAKYFGDIGVEPPLPPDINTILQSSCPYWQGKKVQDTHLLVLIPQTVNGKSLTLRTLGELVQSPKQGSKTKYDYFWEDAFKEHGDTPAESAHWVLFTRDVIPGSRNKLYADQQKLVAQAPFYQVPKVLEAAVCIFMEHARTGKQLYSQNPWTFTRCREKTGSLELCVGGFGAGGLYVYRDYGDDDYGGVGGLRKF